MCVQFLKIGIWIFDKSMCPQMTTDSNLWGIFISLAFLKVQILFNDFLYIPHRQ